MHFTLLPDSCDPPREAWLSNYPSAFLIPLLKTSRLPWNPLRVSWGRAPGGDVSECVKMVTMWLDRFSKRTSSRRCGLLLMLDLDDVENMDKFVGDIIHISFKLLTSWQNTKTEDWGWRGQVWNTWGKVRRTSSARATERLFCCASSWPWICQCVFMTNPVHIHK